MEITQEQWEVRRRQLLKQGVGLVLYDPVTDRTIMMSLTAAKFRKLPKQLQWDAYLLPALQQLELAER